MDSEITQSSSQYLTISDTEDYASRHVDFGFNGLGKLVYQRTYSRLKDDDSHEKWYETVLRVVNGIMEVLELNIDERYRKNISSIFTKEDLLTLYDIIFNMKMLPAGRGLWSLGSKVISEKKLYASLNNCTFVSTKDIDVELVKPFTFFMDMSMLGCGVGFDVRGQGKIIIHEPVEPSYVHVIADTREGWVESLRLILESYFIEGKQIVEFDYSKIRKKGEKLKTFGGLSSGPQPLIELHDFLRDRMRSECKKPISDILIVDIMNNISKVVIAGGIRRCIPENSHVHCRNGMISIKDVEIGQEVLTSDGYRKITDKWEQGTLPVMKIKTKDNEFHCSRNHKSAILTAIGEYKFVEAHEIKSGDRLISTRIAIEGTKTNLPPWNYVKPAHSTTCKDIVVPELDEDMAWFVGIFHADGYTYPNYQKNGSNANISLVFGLEEYDIAEKAKNQIHRFGLTNVVLMKRKNENSYIVSCASKQLAWYCDKNFKQAKSTIRIPDWIMRAKQSIKLAYIAGVIDGDGTTKNTVQILSTIYEQYARDIQSLLYSCGIESRINIQKVVPPSRKGWNLIHYVKIITMRSKEIISKIPQLSKKITLNSISISRNNNTYPYEWIKEWVNTNKKGESTKIFSHLGRGNSKCINAESFEKFTDTKFDLYPLDVISVEECGEAKMYDITVEDRHEFFCEGVLTSNSSSISLGNNSESFLNLKNYELHPERISYGWASNNSVIGHKGMEYDDIAERIRYNGEPGILWLDNVQKYGRFGDETYKRDKAIGINPCGEQPLESYEMCNLVEIFMSKIGSLDEFLKVARYAYYYGKIISLGLGHWQETKEVQSRNRRIGISLSGITQFLTDHDEETLIEWTSTCYKMIRDLDEDFSPKLGVPRSIRLTTIKPSGTISLLAGATPGVHFPFARYYIRRVRIEKDSPLVEASIASGYKVEDDFYCKTASVISVPVHVNCDKNVKNTSIWEKLHLGEIMQKYWSDNSVSITVEFQPEEGKDIVEVLKYGEQHLKSITLLPTSDSHYVQMPYEEISKERYNLMKLRISSFDDSLGNDGVEYELGCTGDSCSL